MRYLLIAIALLFTACGDCKNVTEAVCDAYRVADDVFLNTYVKITVYP